MRVVCMKLDCRKKHWQCACERWTHGPLPCLKCRVEADFNKEGADESVHHAS